MTDAAPGDDQGCDSMLGDEVARMLLRSTNLQSWALSHGRGQNSACAVRCPEFAMATRRLITDSLRVAVCGAGFAVELGSR